MLITIEGGLLQGNPVAVDVIVENGEFKQMKLRGGNNETTFNELSGMSLDANLLKLSPQLIIEFSSAADVSILNGIIKPLKSSLFDRERESSSVQEYFKFYSNLSQQQNMLTDFTRTGTYQRSMFMNSFDFQGKVVCDVGCGTGILSFFAAQAGARKVYSIEASDMAATAKKLVEHNNLSGTIEVIHGKCEEIELPEPVDMIISEPMGILLVNERMLESYIYARKWLKPSGKMFPSKSSIYLCPFSDEQLYFETVNRSTFWTNKSFYGVDVSCMEETSQEENLRQPIVDYVDPRYLVGDPVQLDYDFLTLTEEDLSEITIPFEYQFPSPALIHGIATWFDVSFCGSNETVVLSTSPYHPLTHWYQVRCLFKAPILVQPGKIMKGSLHLVANRVQSYDMTLSVCVDGVTAVSENKINLKEPNFRFTSYSAANMNSNYNIPNQDEQ